MFKIGVLKFLYDSSDDDTERYIRDRLSFRKFLGLRYRIVFLTPRRSGCWVSGCGDTVLNASCSRDSTRSWDGGGWEARGRPIVEGSFVEVPRQRNTREENERIKKSEAPESFEAKAQKE